ncbi:alpha-1,2-fucosyltransferase [Candidatus Nomurabacteria bacterium]|nr:alpha-1,2-fucosyltransferase [Candidatus Nomurabacteria bacterium]
MNKLKLPNVTLCAFGSEKYKESQQKALDYSSKYIEFGKVKNIIVSTNTIDEWNKAVVFDLGEYIDTDFALLIHPDGGIGEPQLWQDEWLKYDYIGAPFPLPVDNFSYRDINGKIQRVGNSVSLRSKKLLDLPKKIGMEWKPFHGYYNEDGYISVNMRHVFEEHGCKFAPLEVAIHFGKETSIPENKGLKAFTYHKTVGENSCYPDFEKGNLIITEMYNGQGLGNQLFCYVTTRVIAKDLGYDFGIMHGELFKGSDFLNLDFGSKVIGGKGPEGGPPKKLPDGINYYYREKQFLHPNGSDIRTYDKNLLEIYPNTKIDGIFQDEKYFEHRKSEIREWLKVKEEYECNDYADENTCVINFRGGEYARHKDLYLSKKYWENAVNNMLKLNKNFKFVVITDDTYEAKKFFPQYDVFHFSIAKDYAIIKNAHYLILSNSSFAWFPAWLSENLKYCIAPKYWAGHNVSDGYWICGYSITAGWMYQDRNGNLSDYDTCTKEFTNYKKSHPDYFATKNNKIKHYKKLNIILSLKKEIGKLLPNKIKNFMFKFKRIRK